MLIRDKHRMSIVLLRVRKKWHDVTSRNRKGGQPCLH